MTEKILTNNTSKLFNDCFSVDNNLLPAADAIARLQQHSQCVVDMEHQPLKHCTGRICAEDVKGQRDVPGFDNAAVDGYAICLADILEAQPVAQSNNQTDKQTITLTVIDRAAAGHPATKTISSGNTIKVLTGAMLPAGTDAIIMQEDVNVSDNTITFTPRNHIKHGTNCRYMGEDIKTGDVIIKQGQHLRPQDIGVAASSNYSQLPVFKKLRIAIFSTGDELQEPGTARKTDGVYDVNRYMLQGLLESINCEINDLGILPDDYPTVKNAIAAAAKDHHAIITSGGASGGDEDHVVHAINTLGSVNFWRIAIKPGRPLAFGSIGQALFAGLPGNPVAVVVCFLHFVRPLLLNMAGQAWQHPKHYQIPVNFDFSKKPGRREYLRARLVTVNNEQRVEQFTNHGSGILTSLTYADGFLEIPEEITEIKKGDKANFIPFSELGLST